MGVRTREQQKLPVKGAFASIISVEMLMFRYMVELLRLYSNRQFLDFLV